MGMAASQARYLGLTARKTNVEYEGQQVNQARTALANQSANLFNQLLTLEVPTAPSTADFTTVQYSYQDGAYEEAISSMSQLTNDPDGYNYMVTHYHFADVFKGQRALLANPQVQISTDDTTGEQTPTYVGNWEVKAYVPGADPDLDAAYGQICRDWPETTFPTADADTEIFMYESFGRTYFMTKEDLLASANSAIDPEKPIENQNIRLTTYYAETINEKVEQIERAVVEIGQDGRAASIQYEDSSAVFALNTETITDEAAYSDAMNQYTYDMAVYEKTIQDINAKTEAIQEQDRTLELRLRQLDTEQDALQTEMEAVKKVIEKNVESTFKTFE
ncbi:MAG: hypothetical protein E7Z93_06205 [Cyanobacteria bacterium SIG32]|nr:hypothetical protein [Cyanobacteria bacterium SIG32]